MPVTRLPPGRHKLSAAEVRESQQRRLRSAAAELLRERGYARITTSPVARRAGVSTATLYRHHGDLWACLLDAYEAAAEMLRRQVQEACEEAAGGGAARVDAAIAAALAMLEANPALAHLLSAEPPAAATDLRDARRRLIESLGGAPAVAAALPLVAARTRAGASGALADLSPALRALLAGPHHAEPE